MRIANAAVLFSAQHRVEQYVVQRERLVAGFAARNGVQGVELRGSNRVGARRVQAPSEGATLSTSSTLDQYLSQRTRSRVAVAAESGRPQLERPRVSGPENSKVEVKQVEAPVPHKIELSPQDKAKIQLITAAVEGMTGKKIHLVEPKELAAAGATKPDEVQVQSALEASMPAPDEAVPATRKAAPTRMAAANEAVFGLSYQYSETYYESETTTFSTQAAVRTEDGMEIQVDLDLSMSRQFVSENSLEVNMAGVLKDPLVINFEGPAAQLTETKYQFDIDSDGTEDQIHFVKPKSGFLALDRDGNGTIDNGGELFGAKTGNGFAELSVFDEDGNNFIDSGDSIYDRLRIWSKDADGTDQLMALGQRGLGAIHLGHIATPFDIKDADNQLQGAVRSSSFYLNENGSAGSVQQIDLAV